MVISTKMKKFMFNYSIKYGESLISVQQNVKYLGLHIDDKLNLKEHIKQLKEKSFLCKALEFYTLQHKTIILSLHHFVNKWYSMINNVSLSSVFILAVI